MSATEPACLFLYTRTDTDEMHIRRCGRDEGLALCERAERGGAIPSEDGSEAEPVLSWFLTQIVAFGSRQ
ncbi:MAG TPA: hypothetical protein VHG91_11450 [Longimicrobium sp.]|nr:hypothetical protein [Longimicrobium sp.]